MAFSSPTSSLPDFTAYGYAVERELGNNRAGGRVTYLAREYNTGRAVVIKAFQFAIAQNQWDEYDLYQREIDILKTLQHPNIPHYLDAFQTGTGFCMVQEYKDAPSLAEPRPWTVHQVRHVAIATLNILNYLQDHIPPIIHRDLKPENILVDDRLEVYLVDFGFARLGGGQVAVSSVVKGTLGFMPPEQLFNRELTLASDLYSLGLTLICMLTQVPTTEVGRLIDERGRVDVASQCPALSPEFSHWLQTLTQPHVDQRYGNATEALQHLTAIKRVTRQEASLPYRLGRAALRASQGIALGGVVAIALVPFWRQTMIVALQQRYQALVAARFPNPMEADERPWTEQVNPTTTFARAINDQGQPVDPLTNWPTEGAWYAHVVVSNMPDGRYRVTCDLLDAENLSVPDLSREAILLVEGGELQSWCAYNLDAIAAEAEAEGVDVTLLPSDIHGFRLKIDDHIIVERPLRSPASTPNTESTTDG